MITVTGPTGGIGRHVLTGLLDHEEPVRVVCRDPQKLPAAVRARVEIVEGSHFDPDVIDHALDGARALFWLVAGDITAASPYDCYVGASIPAAAAIVRHQVEQVVTVSALGRGTQRYTGYVSASLAMDDLLRNTGANLRALAAPSLMDNFLRDVDSLRQGVVRGAAPADMRAPMVARRDIGAVAAALLLDPTWTGQDEIPVLGPEDLSYNDVTEILTDVLRRPVRYERGDLEQSEQAMIGFGVSEGMAQAITAMARAKLDGLDNVDSIDRATVTPTTLRQWSQDELEPAVNAD